MRFVLFFFLGLLFIASGSAQESRSYTCGPDFRPSDVTFDDQGRMYSASPGLNRLLYNPGQYYFYPLFQFDTAVYRVSGNEKRDTGAVYVHNGNTCQAIKTKAGRVFSLAAVGPKLCTNAYEPGISDIPEDNSVTNRLDCWTAGRWSRVPVYFIPPEGLYIGNGLLALGDALWFSSWVSRKGSLYRLTLKQLDADRPAAVVVNELPKTNKIELPGSLVPHFMTSYRQTEVMLTAFSVLPAVSIDNLEKVTGSKVFRTVRGKPRQVFSSPSLLSGVVALEQSFFMADYYTGELLEISMQGDVLHTFRGLEGPMGMARAPNGDLCVAEMLGGRVRCFALSTLRQD